MANGWRGLVPQENGTLLFECPEPWCYHRLLVKTENHTTHACPAMGHTTYAWSETVRLVSKIWAMLDDCIDIVKNPEIPQYDRDIAGNQARAYCNTLVLFMTPIFPTTDDIGREGIKRWKARQAGTEHHTPGMMHATYKTVGDGEAWYLAADGGHVADPFYAVGPPTITPDAVRARMQSALSDAASQSGAEATRLHWKKQGKVGITPDPVRVAAEAKRAEGQPLPLDPQQRKAVRDAMASGMFLAADITKMYGLTEAQVNAIVASSN